MWKRAEPRRPDYRALGIYLLDALLALPGILALFNSRAAFLPDPNAGGLCLR